MKDIDYSNHVQKEAILNECKGNLFEFLVAQSLASRSKLEDHFLLNLPDDFKMRLSSYEELIRIHEPKLLIKLPELSRLTVSSIWEKLQFDNIEFTQWKVIGKIMATNDNELWNETDIVGSFHCKAGLEKHLALSIKLSKDHSYTNTKSAGVKSFLTKYFGNFNELAVDLQSELNNIVNESFLMMGHQLYLMNDLEFKGSFDAEWRNIHSELPGELPIEMRSFVHQNYHRVALKLAGILAELKQSNQQLFFESLSALCGFSHPEIIQVSCFHQDYELKEITVKNYNDFFSAEKVKNDYTLKEVKELGSSVDIIFGDVILQLRVKPMNKFTTPAYKINCSIKVKK